MNKWVKKISYFVTGAAFIAGGFLVESKFDVAIFWPASMAIIGFVLSTIGGFFVKPEQP